MSSNHHFLYTFLVMQKTYYSHRFFPLPDHALPSNHGVADYLMVQTLQHPALTVSVWHQNQQPVQVYYHDLKHLAQVQFFHQKQYQGLSLGIRSVQKDTVLIKNFSPLMVYTGLEILAFDAQKRLTKHTLFRPDHRLDFFKEYFYDQPAPSSRAFDAQTWTITTLPHH